MSNIDNGLEDEAEYVRIASQAEMLEGSNKLTKPPSKVTAGIVGISMMEVRYD